MNMDTTDQPDIVDELVSAFSDPGESALLDQRSELVARGDREGLLDVAYRTIDSPVGRLLLAATDRGLVRVAFENEDHDVVLTELASAISPRIMRADRRTDDAAHQIDEYFARRRRVFDVAIDLRLVRGFRRTVISHLGDIEYGATESYADVARATGNPRAVRAVGSACAHNPVPVVVPCHRVVRSDGTIGQYLGGPDAKRALLALERSSS